MITVEDFLNDFGANTKVEFPFCGVSTTCELKEVEKDGVKS
jgi:hypothetical protein